MKIKEEIKKLNSSTIPLEVQKLWDFGIIQDYDEVDGINYITFAYMLQDVPFYNYDLGDYYDFQTKETSSVIYCGGMALDSDLNVLKGIIYPYYFDYHEYTVLFDSPIKQSVIKGRPQIITKSANTKLSDWFCHGTLVVFNLVTDKANVWTRFIKGKESYKYTRVFLNDQNYVITDYIFAHTYLGKVFDYKTKEFNGKIITYEGWNCTSKNAVTLDYAEEFVKDNAINKKIISKIYCATIKSNAIREGCEKIETGLSKIADSNITNASIIAGPLYNISKELHTANNINNQKNHILQTL